VCRPRGRIGRNNGDACKTSPVTGADASNRRCRVRKRGVCKPGINKRGISEAGISKAGVSQPGARRSSRPDSQLSIFNTE